MRGILSTLVIFFAILFTSASAHAGGFWDNGGSAAEDYWEDQNRLQNKLAKARADADFKCSRSTYEACMAAQAKVDRLEREANGFGGGTFGNNRKFRSHRKDRDLSAREYWELFEKGRKLGEEIGERMMNNQRRQPRPIYTGDPEGMQRPTRWCSATVRTSCRER